MDTAFACMERALMECSKEARAAAWRGSHWGDLGALASILSWTPASTQHNLPAVKLELSETVQTVTGKSQF